MNFQYSLYGIIPLISAFVVLALAIYGFKRRSSRIHLYFSILAISVFFWCFGYAMEFFSIEMGMNIFWNKISYIGGAIVPAMWVIFVLEYGKYEKYLKTSYLCLLLVLPIIIIIIAFTNEWHGLVWPSIIQISNQSETLLIYKHGLFFWITVIYGCIMTLTGIILLIRMLITSSRTHYLNIFILMLSGLIPMIAIIVYISNIINIPGLDITPFGLTISVILISIIIFKFRFLDILPIAHKMLFKSMVNGVLVFDAENKLIDVNSAANLIGISHKDIGKNANDIFSNFPDFKAFYNGSKSEFELFLGNPINRWIDVHMTSIYDNENIFHGRLVIIQDIDRLKRSLEEKELMMKEIHHRVKNNMQVISSLLSLQSMYHDDTKVRNILRESQNRVQSMALAHERLYQSENLSQIDMKEYIDQVIVHLFTSYRQDISKIKTSIQVESTKMDINTAIPVGLIINELLTNSLKYAFPQGSGKLSLKLQTTNNQYLLTVADDGIGLPANFQIDQTKTLGFQLVNRLLIQLRGSIELNGNEGTKFCIKFPYRDQNNTK